MVPPGRARWVRPPRPRRRRTASCRGGSRRRRGSSSSACVPCSTIWPCSITRMTSAPRIVDRRWAITKLVRFDAQRVHRLLDLHLGAGVDRAGRLVEDEDRRLGEEGAGDRQQLLLAGADVVALLVDQRVVAVGQRVHEAVDVASPCAAARISLLGGAGLAVGDVVADRAAEQPRVLQHHADAATAARGGASIAMSRPSSVMRAAVELVEPHDQVDERRLAGAGRPDDGDGLAGLGDEREVLDERHVGVVGERDVVELDAPGDRRRRARASAGRATARRRRGARAPARARRCRTGTRSSSTPAG